MICDHEDCKVGLREKVRLGSTSILGCGEGYLFLDETINSLHYNGFFTLFKLKMKLPQVYGYKDGECVNY